MTDGTDVQDELARAELQEAHAARERFLARLSHDLRTPMNGVIGFSQLLAMENLGEPASDYVDHILKSGRLLVSMLDELMEQKW